jgi:hypothetical protein
MGHLQHTANSWARSRAGSADSVAAQHPAPGTPRAALDQQIEQPVFPDGTTAQALAGLNRSRVAA